MGCGRLDELTLQAPLVLTERNSVRLQVAVGAPDATGSRPVEVYSRAEEEPSNEAAERPWTRHATGLLGAGEPETGPDLTAWPPTGAEPVPVDGYYRAMADAGYAYGPAFRGLRAVWRRGDEVFAEAAIDDAPDAARYGLHPALLDSALHAMGFGGFVRDGGGLLPFSWSGMRLFGRGAAAVRVRLTAAGTDAVSAEVADGAGRPVAALDSLVLRPVSGEGRSAPGGHPVSGEGSGTGTGTGTGLAGTAAPPDSLFRLDWTALALAEVAGRDDAWSLPGPDDLRLGAALRRGGATVSEHAAEVALVSLAAEERPADPAAGIRAATARALGLVQGWLADEEQAAARLVVVTRGAVAVRVGEDITDLVHAPVWGLLRTAQAENPDRLLLVDLDGDEASVAALPGAVAAAAAAGESQLALRGGAALVPRLAPVGSDGTLVPPRAAARGGWTPRARAPWRTWRCCPGPPPTRR
ncbi:polyketide synthase dehydratase domain-containing protein [Streptomyces sp. FXJ1.4098]|nr:polyketide synthase dehydratase domain-containing protein [Streptomyces sp. FXJ1.4098]